MSYKTIDAVEKAFDDAKELLLPFSLKTWAKLALIAVMAGGSGGTYFPGMPSGGSDYDPNTGQNSADFSDIQSFEGQELSNMATGAFTSAPATAAIIGILIAIVGIVLLFMYVSSVFEFIYYQSLIDRDVQIVSNFRNNMGSGFRLFSFRFIWTFLMILVAGAALLLVVLQPLMIVPLLLLMLPLIIVVTVINIFVNTFVVLEMLETGNGFIESAKSVYTDVKAEWKEFVIYVVMNIVLGMAVGIVVGVGTITALLALAIPLAIIGILLYWISWVLVIPVAVIGVLVFILIVLIGFIAPTATFMYYYSIEVYSALTSR